MNKWEKVVYEYYNTKSKRSMCCRFQDSLDASKKAGLLSTRQSKRMVYLDANPSDLMITDNGDTYYAEVKHTCNTKGINSSLLEEQRMFRDRILNCGGNYQYFIYADDIGQWYKIPGAYFQGKGIVKWKDIGQYMVNYLPKVY